jgi:hypothetical protein
VVGATTICSNSKLHGFYLLGCFSYTSSRDVRVVSTSVTLQAADSNEEAPWPNE